MQNPENPMQVKMDQYSHFQGTVVDAQPLPPMISAQGVTAVGVSSAAPSAVYVHSQPAPAMLPNNGRQPPRNRWADSICDWPSNLFPSCYCVCCVCCGMYLAAQIAQKVGYASFQSVMWAFFFFCIIGFIMQLIFGNLFIIWFPLVFAFIFSVGLRLYIARKDDIRDCGGCFGECCTACWCWYCSVSQMARHVYGYTKVLDGDGDPFRPDDYLPQQQFQV